MKTTGLDIKKFREKHGLSQSDFSELIGVSYGTIQNYEKGNVIPKSKMKLLKFVFNNYSPKAVNEMIDIEIIAYIKDNADRFREIKSFKMLMQSFYLDDYIEDVKKEVENQMAEHKSNVNPRPKTK